MDNENLPLRDMRVVESSTPALGEDCYYPGQCCCSICGYHEGKIMHQSGSYVCSKCGHVLAECLTVQDVHGAPPPQHRQQLQYSEIHVDCESLYDAVRTRTDRLNIPDSIVNAVQRTFVNVKNKINMIYSSKVCSNKGKRLCNSNENILCFAIYYTLKSQDCSRPLKVVSHACGVNHSTVVKIEALLDRNLTLKRLKPPPVQGIIETFTQYMDENFTHIKQEKMLKYSDIIAIVGSLKSLKPYVINPPLVKGAGLLHLYTNNVLRKKMSYIKAGRLFGVQAISVKRFVKEYSSIFSNLVTQ